MTISKQTIKNTKILIDNYCMSEIPLTNEYLSGRFPKKLIEAGERLAEVKEKKPPKRTRSIQHLIWLSPDEDELLRVTATVDNVSMQHIFRQGIRMYAEECGLKIPEEAFSAQAEFYEQPAEPQKPSSPKTEDTETLSLADLIADDSQE